MSRGEERRFIFFNELNARIDGGVVFTGGSCNLMGGKKVLGSETLERLVDVAWHRQTGTVGAGRYFHAQVGIADFFDRKFVTVSSKCGDKEMVSVRLRAISNAKVVDNLSEIYSGLS